MKKLARLIGDELVGGVQEEAEWCDQVLWVLSPALWCNLVLVLGVQTTLVHSLPPAQSQVLELVATWPAPDRHQLW